MNWEAIAEIAYTAYRAKLGTIWRSPPPGWLNLHQNERNAWCAAAEAAHEAAVSGQSVSDVHDKIIGFVDPIKIGDWVIVPGDSEKFMVTNIMELNGHDTAWLKNKNGGGHWRLCKLTKVPAPEGTTA